MYLLRQIQIAKDQFSVCIFCVSLCAHGLQPSTDCLFLFHVLLLKEEKSPNIYPAPLKVLPQPKHIVGLFSFVLAPMKQLLDVVCGFWYGFWTKLGCHTSLANSSEVLRELSHCFNS